MTLFTEEVTWLRWLLADFGVSAAAPTRDPVKHKLTKHIGVDASFVCADVQDQVLALHYVPSELQLVDFFIKAQTKAQHSFFLSKLSVVPP
jgi:hypothetical protein